MKNYFGFTVAGDRSDVQTARRIVLLLESMGHEVLNHHLVGDNAWPTLPERAYGRLPSKTPRPNVCTAN
jgi:hypothetical protein